MDKHGAAWLFCLLLIFLFSFLSFLVFSLLPLLLHTPHPHPPPLFFFFFFFYWTLFLYPSTIQGIPQTVLPPLPKRPALEKTNGATAVFNTGIFQYQQALANMQLQQHTAFLPPGKCFSFAFFWGGRRGNSGDSTRGGNPVFLAGSAERYLRGGWWWAEAAALPAETLPCRGAAGGGALTAGRLASLCFSRKLGGCFPV